MSDGGYFSALIAYGGLGIALCALYAAVPKLRGERWAHGVTGLVVAASSIGVLRAGDVTSALADPSFTVADASYRGFLFLGAAVCHVPLVVSILVCALGSAADRVATPEPRVQRRSRRRTRRAAWQDLERLLGTLAREPFNAPVREKLAQLYFELGFVDSAIYEFRRAIDATERGYEQARLLYKVGRMLAERQRDLSAALSVLRRLDRLYPRSAFAQHARALIRTAEARTAKG